MLRQRWLESGAPASKTCKFEGTQKEWEEKELREGCPSFGNNLRKFNRARANHWRWGGGALPTATTAVAVVATGPTENAMATTTTASSIR